MRALATKWQELPLNTPEQAEIAAPAPYCPPPLTLLPPELQDYIEGAAAALNVDASYVLLPKLSALGSAVGNARSVLLKRGFIQPPVIWTGNIGPSGSRKSPGLEAGCFAVLEYEKELIRRNKVEEEMYAEALAEWESKKKPERGAKPEPPLSLTCLMDDLTLAALADAIEANPHGVLVTKDELSHWFEAMDQFHDAKGSDVARWLSLHSGVFFGFDRKTDRRRFRLYQPRVCITGGIQPGVLARVLTQDFFERGLPARFLFAFPPVRKDRWSETVVDARLRESVMHVFARLYELEPEREEGGEARPKLLQLDADAKAEYVLYYNECGDAASEGDEREEAAWSKLSGYAARLALVGQLARAPDAETVTGEVMRAACHLARWFGREATRIYSAISETAEQRETRRLVQFIEHRGGTVTARELITYYRPMRNQTEKATEALSALVKAGRGEWVEIQPEGRGRRTRRFRLLRPSASAQIATTRRETGNSADADVVSSQKNAYQFEADIGAVPECVATLVPELTDTVIV